MNCYFVIVSAMDTPVYETDLFKPEIAVKVRFNMSASLSS